MKTMLKLCMVLVCLLVFFACGQEPAIQTISLSGTVGGEAIAQNPGKDIMLIVMKGEKALDLASSDLSSISTSMDEIVEYISVDRASLSFQIDLTEKGVQVGDELAIVAFVDVIDDSSIPFPNPGDFIGFYLDKENMSFTYTLHNGKNTDIYVPITREIFDFDVSVKGTISGKETGDMTLVAYAGNITSEMFNFEMDDLNIDDVVGFAQIEKTSETQSFTMDILPMGKNIPIHDVTLLGIMDLNENGKFDSGDRIAYVPDGRGYPSSITIDHDTAIQHMELIFTLPEPSGYSVPLVGTVEMPTGEYLHKDSPPLYLLVVAMDDVSSLSSLADLSTLFTDDNMKLYFQQLKTSSKAGQSSIDFNIDLSRSTFVAGDNVLVAALWDKDGTDGYLPSPSTGDRFGFYNNKDTYKFTITLADESEATENKIPWLGADEFKLNKVWYDHDVSIEYRIDKDQPAALNYKIGDKIMVALVQKEGLPINFQSFFNPTMDIDYVVGIQMIEIEKNTFGKTFEMKLWPIQREGLVNGPGFNIQDVGLFAMLGMDGLEFSGEGEYTVGHYYQTGWFGNPIVLPEYFDISDEFLPFTMPEDHGIRFFPLLKF